MANVVEALAAAVYGHLATARMIQVGEHRNGSPRMREIRQDDLNVMHFMQEWSNTLCAFSAPDLIAGQGFTRAYTTIITHGDRSYIYCDGAFVYAADRNCDSLLADLKEGGIADIGGAEGRYRGFSKSRNDK